MPDQDRPRKPPALRGFLQGVQLRKIRGWAFVPARPGEHVRVELRVDGALIATAAAAAYAESLAINDIGNGDHGFLFKLEEDLPIDEPARIEVTAVGAQGESLVLRRPLAHAAATPQAAPVKPFASPRPSPDIKQPDIKPPPDVAPASGEPPAPAAAAVQPPASARPASALRPRFLPVDRAQRPLFVLGSARSGTSAMIVAVRKSTRYVGPPEGHLLDLLPKLLDTVRIHYQRSQRELATSTLIAEVPIELVQEGVQNIFAEIVRERFPSGFWIDKTPGPLAIKAAPALARIWPEARFIFMKRHPVGNIQSRRRKFATIGFKEHCQLWADSMTAWEAVRDALAPVSVEIEQLQMAREPRAVAEQVVGLLDLGAHEAGRLLQSLQSDRPQRTSDTGADVASWEDLDWSEEDRAIFRRICTGPMKRFGYTLGEG